MPPKQQPQKKKAAEPVEIPASAKLYLGIFVGLCLAVLWWATTESSDHALNRQLVASLELTGVNGIVRANGDRPALFAKTNIQSGQSVVTLPTKSVLDMRVIQESTLGQILQADNASLVQELAQEHKLTQGGFTMLNYALFLAFERRKGAASHWATLFDMLGDSKSGMLYWPEDVQACFDLSLGGEQRELASVTNMSLELTQRLCEDEDAAGALECKDKPLTEDEVKWGLNVYMQNNFQDQAIIPVVNFATFDNAKQPLQPRFDQQSNTLMFSSQAPIAKGEKITLNFLRSPNMLLAGFGQFDVENARGIELALQLPQDDETIQKYCAKQVHELQFGTNGRPRSALVDCMTVLVTEGKARARLAKSWRKGRTPEVVAMAWGNLTVGASRLMNDEIVEEQCAAVSGPLADKIRTYTAWRREVLKANFEYCQQQMVETFQAAGMPLPQGPPPGEEEGVEGLEQMEEPSSAEDGTDSEL